MNVDRDPKERQTEMPIIRKPLERIIRTLILGAAFLAASGAGATALAEDADKLIQLSLEDLLDLEVESVSRKPERLGAVASSIYVIEREDIRRSGATRITEVLQLVPGTWFRDHSYDLVEAAVREETLLYAGTVLILLDGIPIVDPFSSGFDYRFFDIDLDQIERIEVIKGPGGTIYGANAATGIISIFTRRASGHQLQTKLETGSNGYLAPSVRFDTGSPKVGEVAGWVRYKSHDGYERNPRFVGETVLAFDPFLAKDVTVPNRFDFVAAEQRIFTAGVQHRRALSASTTLQNFVYANYGHGDRLHTVTRGFPETPGEPLPDSLWVSDGRSHRLLFGTRLDREFGPQHTAFAHLHFLETYMDVGGVGGISRTDVLELELQDNRVWGSRHALSAGLNGRWVAFTGKAPRYSNLAVARERRDEFLYAAFLQDAIALHPELSLTLGAKVETWTLIGNEPNLSPSVRMAWAPTEQTTVWSAASRGITVAGTVQTDVAVKIQQVPPPWYFENLGVPPALVPEIAGKWLAIVPSERLRPTDFNTYEVGVRTAPLRGASLDVSGFYSVVDHRPTAIAPTSLQDAQLVESPAFPGEQVIPVYFANQESGSYWGGETVLRTHPMTWMRVELSHSWLRSVRRVEGRTGTDSGSVETLQQDDTTPTHVGRARLYLDLPRQFDLTVNGVLAGSADAVQPFDYLSQKGATEETGVVLDRPRSDLKLDVIVQKRFGPALSLQAWGRDLLNDSYVDAYVQYAYLGHPHTVGRSFGAAVRLDL